ncbi:MAG: PilN domain-containing protein [Candidatus Firestonebacteria bacterium]
MHIKWFLDLSTDVAKLKRLKKKQRLFYIAGIPLLILSLIFNITVYNKINKIKNSYRANSKESLSTLKDLNDEFSYVNSVLEKKNFSWSKFLSHLEHTVPNKISITSIIPSFSGGNTTIEGISYSIDDLTNFLKNLQNSKRFKDVFLLEQKNTSLKNINFAIILKYLDGER